MFDLNTLLAYRTTFAVDRVSTHEGCLRLARRLDRDAQPGCRAQARIEVFAPQESGLYERITTVHAQRHFPRPLVVDLLGRAGLRCIGVYGVRADGSLVPKADELRQLKVLYVARLAKGGVAE